MILVSLYCHEEIINPQLDLIIEVMYKGIESIEITENQKDQIQGLFVQGISSLRGTLNVMFNLQK